MKEKKTMGRNAQAACVNYTACQSKWDLELNTPPRVKTAWQCEERLHFYTNREKRYEICGKSLRNPPERVNVLEESQRGLTSMRQRRPRPIISSVYTSSTVRFHRINEISLISASILAPNDNAKHHSYMVHGSFLPETISRLTFF